MEYILALAILAIPASLWVAGRAALALYSSTLDHLELTQQIELVRANTKIAEAKVSLEIDKERAQVQERAALAEAWQRRRGRPGVSEVSRANGIDARGIDELAAVDLEDVPDVTRSHM